MRRTARWILCFSLAPCLLLGHPALADDANLLYGRKSLSEGVFDTAGVDAQSQIGVAVTLDFQWPVALAVDLLSSSDDQTDRFDTGPDSWLAYSTSVDSLELNVGARKLWERKVLKPYVGGGLAWIQLDVRQTESGVLDPGGSYSDVLRDDSDSGLGFWLDAGLVYRLGRRFNVGLDVRYSNASAKLSPVGDLEGLTVDAGGMHYGILLGYHW